ncbi:MAG TPA: T9SS type A sorting domain-containing protein [Bacteroidota bacterium]|nr:T9SS type A sorting domain-containing protein [Bacteroidota bacterium]
MKLSNKFYLLMCVSLVVLMSQTLRAQTSIKFYGSDGGGITDSLLLVVHPSGHNDATPDSIDPATKESSQGLPPPPQGIDLRVIPNFGWDGLPNYTSIHKLNFDTQTDVWKVQFQRDAAQSGMTFTWQSGLAGVGLGYWRIVGDENDADAGVAALNIDMTTQTALNVPLPDADAHVFYIRKGDGAKMRTFTPDDVADAVDSKGKKTKAEKRKAYNSEGCFTFIYSGPDTAGPTTALLYVEFSQAAVNDVPLSSGGLSASSAGVPGKKAKWNFDLATANDTLHNGDPVQICYRGNKGKALVVKKWSLLGLKQPTPPLPDLGPVPARLLLKMPNVNNIGEECYVQIVWPETYNAKPAGIVIGTQEQSGLTLGGKPRFKFVYHPKWKDVTKTFADKTGKHSGAANCLENFQSTKPIEKAQKALPPGKMSNVLVSEALALAFNIGASDADKTETPGFGDMVYVNQLGDPAGLPAGSTLRQIDAKMDSIMSCLPTDWGGTYLEWWTVLNRINAAFSGAFDTLSFGDGFGPKPAATRATGVKAIADVDFLYRTSTVASPAIGNPLDLRALEAVPEKYELAQNYPNPFNPATTIEFSLTAESFVTLKVYNLLGQEVATLAENEQFDEGTNEVVFDASKMASGVYYYRMIVNNGDFQEVKKMLLMK